jgi:hypothetical protein
MQAAAVKNANNVEFQVTILETELIFDSVRRYRYACLPAHMRKSVSSSHKHALPTGGESGRC